MAWLIAAIGVALAGLAGIATIRAAPMAQAAPMPIAALTGARAHPAILSLNPCTDAILAEVADPAQIVALSAYSRDPAQSSMDVALARRFPATDGTLEEIVARAPDVVVSGTLTPPATRAALGRLNIPLIALPIAANVAQSLAQIRSLAALTGHRARGEALIARIMAALRAGAPLPNDTARPAALVWESGGMVTGRDTLIADLVARAGFADFATAHRLRQGELLPLEMLLADPPRLILAAGNPLARADRLLAHPALAALTRTTRVRLDPSLLWCGGPTIIRAAPALARARLHLRETRG